MGRAVLRTTKNIVTGGLCCKLCCCVRIYKIKLLIWVIKSWLCKGPTSLMGCAYLLKPKGQRLFSPKNLRWNTVNVLASRKLRKSEVDPLTFCPGPHTLQHQLKLPFLCFSATPSWKSREAGERMPLCQIAPTAHQRPVRKSSLAAPCHKQSVSNCPLQKS